jgi:membrane protein YdbS with pleckstrin-like domain
MGYIEDNLMPNEKILFSAQVNPAIFLSAVVTFVFSILFIILIITGKEPAFQISNGVIAILFFLLTIRFTVEAAVIMFTTEFAITNQRIIAKRGLIHRNTLEILLSKVESVSVYQNILGRLLDFGTVTVTGTGGTKESFKAIIAPVNVRKKVNQVIQHYAQLKIDSTMT